MRVDPFLSLTVPALASAEYVWPSQHDQLDDLFYLRSGYIKNGALSDQVLSCAFNANQPGIQKSAQWLRVPFHDAITHDVAQKTGGLDASIQYELGRPENFGAALNDTMADISSSFDIRTSASDLISLAMVMAVGVCSDVNIPLRMGRLDATEAGPAGVPEPETNLEATTEQFAAAGFSQADMITLVACGHTLGGVHRTEHPDIVTTGPDTPTNEVFFDTTTGSFDNAVVNEWLNDTTGNPLVRATNNTLNSDKRIFGSDGNVTMHKLADTATFMDQCGSALQRLIDTVPGDVTLTEPLQAADIRPYIDSYQLVGNEVQLAGRIRVRTSSDTGRNASDLTVTLLPKDRHGRSLAPIDTTLPCCGNFESYGANSESFAWYEFRQNLTADALKTFDVKIADSTGPSMTSNNGGTGGFPLNPDILYQFDSSCTDYNSSNDTGVLQVVAAIRKELLANGAVPKTTVVRRDAQSDSPLPKLSQQSFSMQSAGLSSGDFDLYRVNITLPGATVFGTTFDISVGESKVEYIKTISLGSDCSITV